MKYFLLLIFIYSSLFCESNVSKKVPLEKVSLQLHWKYQFEFAGFIAAKEKGFYRDVGLDVEIKENNQDINIEDEVIRGKADYGLYNSYTLIDYLEGKPLKLVASFFKRAALVLITSPDIHSPKDLIGKKVMAENREDFIFNFKPYLDGYGVDINDIIIVPNTYNTDDFIAGKVDAMTAFISNEPHKLDMKNVRYNILNPSDDNLYGLQMELFTSVHETLYHPKRVSAFKKASIKGWEYALSHKDEIIDIIYDKYTKKISKESLRDEAICTEKLVLPHTYDIGSIDKNYLNKQVDFFKDYYHIQDVNSVDDFIFKGINFDKQSLFNKEELAYLKNESNVNVCINPDIYPIDGVISGTQTGIMGDIYDLVSQKTELNFIPIATKDYKDLVTKVNSKECAVVSILPTQTLMFPNMVISKPFFNTYFTLISTINKSFIKESYELKNKKLLVQFEIYKNQILAVHPSYDIEVENNVEKMMKRLLKGEVHSVIAANEVADYMIDEHGRGKLKINGFLAKNHVIKGSFASQKDDPVLTSILQKSFDDISSQQIDEIIKNWRLTRYHDNTNYNLIIKIVIIALIIVLIMIYYQRILHRTNDELASTIKELVKKDQLLVMQSKQAAMGEMINIIAHQWRQPLSTITLQISNIQFSKMMGKDVPEEEVSQALSDISDRIIYLSDTVDDFQTYFRPNKEKTSLSVDEFLNKVISLNDARIKVSNIDVGMETGNQMTLHIYLNELIQVLLNIINNAIDAFETVDNDKKKIDIEVYSDKEYIYFSITDNASGIQEKHMKRLFEPDFSTKGKKGSGLGLYMSKMIIQKQFDGDIDVSTSSIGTTFIVKIVKNS